MWKRVFSICEILHKKLKGKLLYIFWFIFYYWMFIVLLRLICWPFRLFSLWFLTPYIVFVLYLISILFAFSGVGEGLWRTLSGVRPLRLNKEKARLLPLFKEVYEEAVKADERLPRNIRLYIKEDMGINAYAFGTETLVLTRGSICLLSDDCIKGLIAHEFGHFSHLDTVVSLFMTIANFYYSFLMVKLEKIKTRFDNSRGSIFSFLLGIIYWIFKSIQNLSNLLLMNENRKQEYEADNFAVKSGFGDELATALIDIYEISGSKPQTVKEMLNSSHPPITKRIERIENSCK